MNEYTKWLSLVKEAKQESNPSFLTPCLFDGPRKVSKEDIDQVTQELEDAQKLKEKKEKAAREEASYRQERQKFHDTFADAQRRREHWYSQQGSGSRRWDSFHNAGNGSKRSPNHKTHQQSHRSSDSKRGSQTEKENPFSTNGTHYGVLDIPRNATEATIKKAYRKVRHSSIFLHLCYLCFPLNTMRT